MLACAAQGKAYSTVLSTGWGLIRHRDHQPHADERLPWELITLQSFIRGASSDVVYSSQDQFAGAVGD